MIDRMTAAGLLERAPNPADRRGSLLRLSRPAKPWSRTTAPATGPCCAPSTAAHGGELHEVLNSLATDL